MTGRNNPLSGVIRRFPALKPYADRYQVTQGDGLEYYPQGEEWSPNPKQRVLQIPQGTSADDVAGEIVSHDLAQGVDPALSAQYGQFQRSMTPDQESRLQEQYQWARDHEGETRPFEMWRKHSGQPAYFRGDLFNQWGDTADLYTPGQQQVFDKMRGQLRGRPR